MKRPCHSASGCRAPSSICDPPALPRRRAGAALLLFAGLLAGFAVPTSANDPALTATIWVHGFDVDGASRSGVYGDDAHLKPVAEAVASMAHLPVLGGSAGPPPPDVVTATTYYGSTPPAWYTPADVADVDRVTAEWGGGVPRYALIVAKYARHLLERTGARQVNFASASFGSLIVRWLIEKDVEGLASEGRIARWLSAEGVLCGNWAASRAETAGLLDRLALPSIDLRHMAYGWIEANLHSPRTDADDPLFAGILLGQFGSTDDTDLDAALSVAMASYHEFQPNDGVQALPDAYFHAITAGSRLMGMPPTLSLFRSDHYRLGDHPGAQAQLVSFLTQRRRVTVTMTGATIYDLHEVQLPFWDWRPAEIVFESRAYSPAVETRWGITEPLSTVGKEGAVAPLRMYRRNGESQSFRQVVFDDFVLDDESELRLELSAEEIDQDWRYGVFETTQAPSYDLVGAGTIRVSTRTPGTYAFHAGDWACSLDLGVVEYPFGDPVGVEESSPPGGPASLAILPNPFSSSVRVAARAPTPALAGRPSTLSIYDASGRLIRRIAGKAGDEFVWDGRDEVGRPVPAGLYVQRLDTPGGVLYGRSLLLR